MAIVKITELPAVTPPLTGDAVVPVVQGSVTSKATLTQLGSWFPVSVLNYGADPTGVADSTAAFVAALAAADNVYVPQGEYRIDGTITLPQGATLFGDTNVGQYFGGQSIRTGTRLFKDVNSSAGPIVKMTWASGLRNLQFIHDKLNGATDGIILFPNDQIVTYAAIDNCHIFGSRTADTTGSTTCYGIKFAQADLSTVNYFNRVSNVHITDCDVCVYMGNQANANVFTNVQTRESHIHYELDGGVSECIENVFSGIGLFSISGSLSPTPVGFKLTDAKNNVFIGYTTEMFGTEFEEGSGNTGNIFLGQANEAFASYTTQTNLRYMVPVNVQNQITSNFVNRLTGDRNVIGIGASFQKQFEIGGTMPDVDNNAGTFNAASASSKVIFRFPAGFTKAAKRSFRGRLKVFTYGPFGSGVSMADVEFLYRMTDQASSAGSFSVTSVTTKGNQITGLYFLTGVAASTNMGVGLTGGNYAATPFSWIRCFLEIEVLDFGSNADFFNVYNALTSTTTAAATANDVTDSIDMLTVADTSV